MLENQSNFQKSYPAEQMGIKIHETIWNLKFVFEAQLRLWWKTWFFFSLRKKKNFKLFKCQSKKINKKELEIFTKAQLVLH